MSALMAERRDWAEDPRQPSLFDALAPPREQPAEQGRVVEFPKRPEVAPAESSAPGQPDLLEGAPAASLPDASGEAPATSTAAAAAGGPAEVGIPAPAAELAASSLASAEADSAFAAASEFELAAMPQGAAVIDTMPAVEGASAIEAELVVTPVEFDGESCTPRAAGSPLAGPTLDDVMSRVWEGLTMGLPAACPLCDGEVLPATAGPRRGSCTSCGTTID